MGSVGGVNKTAQVFKWQQVDSNLGCLNWQSGARATELHCPNWQSGTLATCYLWSTWSDVAVFGNTGLHIVLKGSVRPHNKPHIKFVEQQINFRSPTPEPRDPLPQVPHTHVQYQVCHFASSIKQHWNHILDEVSCMHACGCLCICLYVVHVRVMCVSICSMYMRVRMCVLCSLLR